MAIIFTAVHVCQRCEREFEWSCNKPIRKRWDEEFVVEAMPSNNKAIAHVCEEKNSEEYHVEVNCPYYDCGFDNNFEYKCEKQ